MRWLHAGPIHHCCLLRRPASPRASFLRRLAHISLGSRLDPPDPALPRKLQTDKNLLKARDSVKELAGSSSVHFASSAFLLPNQADGFVAAAQANFMRIIVESVGGNLELSPPHKVGMELLCVVRAVLKKIKRRVLVGDQVLVGSVDWVDRRGMIEDVFPRGSEISDPPVANVDHLLVVFSMEEPKLEPFLLTRFLVEAESTGIPVTLALNKLELVDEETLLRGQTTVIMGPSGVGKSSLINALRSDDQYKVASEGDTTVDVSKVLSASEPAKCSFNDCLHLGEPGCLMKGDWERYKMGEMGVKQAEPRLEFKKHRRQSRKRINQSILAELDQELTDYEEKSL